MRSWQTATISADGGPGGPGDGDGNDLGIAFVDDLGEIIVGAEDAKAMDTGVEPAGVVVDETNGLIVEVRVGLEFAGEELAGLARPNDEQSLTGDGCPGDASKEPGAHLEHRHAEERQGAGHEDDREGKMAFGEPEVSEEEPHGDEEDGSEEVEYIADRAVAPDGSVDAEDHIGGDEEGGDQGEYADGELDAALGDVTVEAEEEGAGIGHGEDEDIEGHGADGVERVAGEDAPGKAGDGSHSASSFASDGKASSEPE